MDITLLIVVEAKSDAMAIRALLGPELARRTRIFAAQGGISRVTLARNLLIHEGGPILIVMAADTTTPQLVEERKALARAAVESLFPGGLGGDGLVRVAFVPEIEVVFFEAPEVLGRLLGAPVPEETVQEGLLIPRRTLARLFLVKGPMPTREALFALLANSEIANLILQGKQASALKETVRSMLAIPDPTS